eukprot:scaffold26372_cov120-Isochrysis_galbana.AAC.7
MLGPGRLYPESRRCGDLQMAVVTKPEARSVMWRFTRARIPLSLPPVSGARSHDVDNGEAPSKGHIRIARQAQARARRAAVGGGRAPLRSIVRAAHGQASPRPRPAGLSISLGSMMHVHVRQCDGGVTETSRGVRGRAEGHAGIEERGPWTPTQCRG